MPAVSCDPSIRSVIYPTILFVAETVLQHGLKLNYSLIKRCFWFTFPYLKYDFRKSKNNQSFNQVTFFKFINIHIISDFPAGSTPKMMMTETFFFLKQQVYLKQNLPIVLIDSVSSIVIICIH